MSLRCAGDCAEIQLALVRLRPGSGIDACVSGIHVDCIAAEAPRCHVFLNPLEAPSNSH